MSFPFFDFINKIGESAKAFDAFVADPDGDPDAARLTAVQKKVLLSGVWENIDHLVRIENPGLAEHESQTIGWNMKVVGEKMLALHQSARATP